MGIGLEAVFNKIKDVLADEVYCYSNQNLIVSEESRYDIVSATFGNDLDGDFVIYEISNTDYEGSILSNVKINLSGKYTVALNDTYINIGISEHTESMLGNDVIKCYGVPTVALPGGIDEATFLSLKLLNSAYFTSEPIQINIRPPHMKLFGGEKININLSCREDNSQSNLDDYTQQIISYIMKNYRKFDIEDAVGTVVGYYKLTALPIIESGIYDGDNTQSVNIILEGFYTRNYK